MLVHSPLHHSPAARGAALLVIGVCLIVHGSPSLGAEPSAAPQEEPAPQGEPEVGAPADSGVGDISYFCGGYTICRVTAFPAKWAPSGALQMFWDSGITNPACCESLLANSPKWNAEGCPGNPAKPECQRMRNNRCHRQWPYFVCATDACRPKYHTSTGYQHKPQCIVSWCNNYDDATYDGSPAQPSSCQMVPTGPKPAE